MLLTKPRINQKDAVCTYARSDVRWIRRVFKKLGLVAEDASDEDIIRKARSLRPSFPGELDYPCWEIGSSWCRINNPYCYYEEDGEEDNCPLVEDCPSSLKAK